MNSGRFAGYGVVGFSESTRRSLVEVAERLLPHVDEIISRWISLQWRTWQPPGIGRGDLEQTFRSLFQTLVTRLHKSELEQCLVDMEQAGKQLADRSFPFRALIISIHFMEESYIRHLLTPEGPKSRRLLIAMDEFLHSVLAAVATSYFDAYRKEILDQAEVGRVVQESLLSAIPGSYDDIEIAHIYVSARERAHVGGDFIDSFEINGRGLAFIIGDLSGHGLDAVADSVMLRSLFRGFMREQPDIAYTLQRMNRVLFQELRGDRFATALAVVYEGGGRLRLVGAGHPYPIVCGGDCAFVEVRGSALAISEEVDYVTETATLPAGGLLVAYTDGLLEAGSAGRLFGECGVTKALGEVHSAAARAVAEHLVDSALRTAGGRFNDDVAVLVIRRRGGS